MKRIIILTLIFTSIISSVSFAQGYGLGSYGDNTLEGTPMSLSCVYLDSNLVKGARDKTTNGSVVNLQAFLRAKGYLAVEPTGFFGAQTFAAVKKFQADALLPQTGFVGPLTRAKMKEVSCGPVQKDLTISLVTDKEVYAAGDTIKMTLNAKNETNTQKVLNFSSGCQTNYMIDGTYNSIAAMLCIHALTTKVIAPQGTVSWELEHDPAQYQLTKGTHTIKAFIQGYGEASKTITVQ